MPENVVSLNEVLAGADALLRSGGRAAPWTWPTGFALLDTYLGGGVRAGELCLLGGPQGLGKTTFVLQVARNVAAGGGSVVVLSYEHDAITLLERLVAAEAAEIMGPEGVSIRRVREALEAGDQAGASLQERLSDIPGAAQAVAALRGYGDRLVLHRSLGSATGIDAVAEVTSRTREITGRPPLVVVDYLQKVYSPGSSSEEERVTTVVQGLKDLALALEVPVLAVAATDREGISAGRRTRIQHLRGSPALAYEADVVLILNDKYDVVARRHLVYDPTSAQRFRSFAVLSIEKNRSGLDGIDLQLRKRFDQGRFDLDLEPVPEQLVDERMYVE